MIYLAINLLFNIIIIYLLLKIILDKNNLFSVDNKVINYIKNYYLFLLLTILFLLLRFFTLQNKLYVSNIYLSFYTVVFYLIVFFAYFFDNPASKTNIELIVYFLSCVIMFLYTYLTIFYSKKEKSSIFNKAFNKNK